LLDVDDNNEDTIDRLLKLRENISMRKDENSAIYALLSQINPSSLNNVLYGKNIFVVMGAGKFFN
jgi:hypothetical protein